MQIVSLLVLEILNTFLLTIDLFLVAFNNFLLVFYLLRLASSFLLKLIFFGYN